MIPITIGVRKFGRNIRHHAIAMTMKMRAHSTKVIWLNVTITQSKKGHDSRPLINKNKAASHGPNTRQVYGSAIHNRFVTRDEAASKIRAGYAGALAGWILGAPHDGKTDWTSVTFYDPANPKAELPPQAVFVQNLRNGIVTGLPRFGAASFAAANVKIGLRAPLSGSFSNPLRESGTSLYSAIGAGVLPGEAAERAFSSASACHAGEAVYGAMFWAAAIASAGFEDSAAACFLRAEKALPGSSALRKIPKGVSDAKRAGCSWQETRGRLLEWLSATPEDIRAAFGFAYLACLYGEGDFAKSICIAAGCGGCASAQAGVVGALVAAVNGTVPEEWLRPISHLNSFEIGTELEDDRLRPIFEPTVAAAAEGQSPAPPDKTCLDDFSAAAECFEQTFQESVFDGADVRAAVSFPNGVCRDPAASHAVAFRIQNRSNAPIELEPIIEAEGCTVAHRARRVRIEPGSSSFVPVIVQAGELIENANLRLKAGGLEAPAPMIPALYVWVASPFDNREQLGYEQVFAPEIDQSPNAAYKGRSGIVIRWNRVLFCGSELDVEPHFIDAPGVAYVGAEFLFDPGKHTAVIESGVGQVVWIGGEKRAWYQNTHIPCAKPEAPYAISFETAGWTKFLIKLVRNSSPLPPVVLYFLNEDGRVMRPRASRQPGTG